MNANPVQRPILAAVDFSKYSEAALTWAASEALVHDVPLVVLHVVHDSADDPGTYRKSGTEGGSLSERLEDAAARLFEEFLDDVRGRNDDVRSLASLTTRVVVGVPATRIIEVATDIEARHIVMGSHGRTGFGHLLLGSKAERVVQLSPVPVTIVKLPEAADEEPAG